LVESCSKRYLNELSGMTLKHYTDRKEKWDKNIFKNKLKISFLNLFFRYL
jgi:hypothetical protein